MNIEVEDRYDNNNVVFDKAVDKVQVTQPVASGSGLNQSEI